MAYQPYPSVAQTTLGGGSGVAEEYYPLWVHSSGAVSTTATATGTAFLGKGSTSTVASSSVSASLLTLNSLWSPNQKFCLEVSGYAPSGSQLGVNLRDMTVGNTNVAGSGIGIISTTATILRSSSFTLTPGHSYGVSIYVVSGAGPAYLTKAHLVALK